MFLRLAEDKPARTEPQCIEKLGAVALPHLHLVEWVIEREKGKEREREVEVNMLLGITHTYWCLPPQFLAPFVL